MCPAQCRCTLPVLPSARMVCADMVIVCLYMYVYIYIYIGTTDIHKYVVKIHRYSISNSRGYVYIFVSVNCFYRVHKTHIKLLEWKKVLRRISVIQPRLPGTHLYIFIICKYTCLYIYIYVCVCLCIYVYMPMQPCFF